MTGVLEVGALAGLGYVCCSASAERRRREQVRFDSVSHLMMSCLRCRLEPTQARTTAVSLAAGQDPIAAAALSTVQRWQDSCDPEDTKPEASSSMSCSVGLFRVAGIGGCGKPPPIKVERSLCENLKSWLLRMASGAVDSKDIAARLEFYRQLLMRPELFPDDSFTRLIAEVCGYLDRYIARTAKNELTCARELAKLLRFGRQIVELIMPVLLLALTDFYDLAETLPLITVETVVGSARNAAPGQPSGVNMFAPFWRSSIGSFVQLIMSTPHFLELWKPANYGAAAPRRPALADKGGDPVVDKWLELTGNVPLAGKGGFSQLFASDPDLQLSYLDLVKDLDNFIKFLSIFDIFKALANREGDAAMHKLRDYLHQMLREIDVSLQKVHKGVTVVSSSAKYRVTALAATGNAFEGSTLAWVERLQCIDDKVGLTKACTGFAESVRDLYHLSHAARAPELEASCRRELQALIAATDSQEFRARCQHNLLALPEPAGEPEVAALEDAAGLSFAVEQDGPVWSVERQIRLVPNDGEEQSTLAVLPSADETLPTFQTVGEAVAALNDQGEQSVAESSAGNFCVVGAQGEGQIERIVLYKQGARDEALIALGLMDAPRESADTSPDQTDVEAVTTAGNPQESLLPAEQPEATLKDEEKYYDLLLMQVLPFFGGEDFLTREQAAVVFERSDLSGDIISVILSKDSSLWKERKAFDAPALMRVGRRVALEQVAKLGRAEPTPGNRFLPLLRGFRWDGSRLRITEPF